MARKKPSQRLWVCEVEWTQEGEVLVEGDTEEEARENIRLGHIYRRLFNGAVLSYELAGNVFPDSDTGEG